MREQYHMYAYCKTQIHHEEASKLRAMRKRQKSRMHDYVSEVLRWIILCWIRHCSSPISIPSITWLLLFGCLPSHFRYAPSALGDFVTGCLPSIYQKIWGYSTSAEKIQTWSMKRLLDLPKMAIPAMKFKPFSPRTDGETVFPSLESMDCPSCHW